jgi:N-acetylmuramoyl-L-alanine amidase
MTLKVSNEAGHAGFGVTPGKRALDGSMYEWEFNDGCVRHFMDELSHYEGVEQLRVDDPTGKRDVPLSERAQKANAWGANLHISFHGNAGPTTASGIETFVYPSTTAHNRQVALTIHNHIINATGRKNRGLKTADFQILRTTKMEALLIEGGFMTNAEELALMKTDAYRSKVGRAAAAGVAESFGLKRKAEPKPVVAQVASVASATPVIRHIYTGGYAGPALLTIHDYLIKVGHGYDVKRGHDGSIIFLIGPFDTSQPNFKECSESIKKFDGHAKLLTREEAAEWRGN